MFFDRKREISFHPILLRRWFMLEEDRPLLQKLAKECDILPPVNGVGFLLGIGKNWIRYERKHSNSMWHTDWTLLDDGRWFITFEDDASRKIMSWGIFDNATSEHSVEVLKKGIENNGKPREMLTGRDTQFYVNEAKDKEQGKTVFQIFLEEQGIKHIIGRVNHPQTNGKRERFFGTAKSKLHEFKSMDDLIRWYNNVRPHMSLDFDNLETPSQAFVRKMHHTAYDKVIVSSR